MADEFKSPEPGTLLEIPGGWDVLYAAGEQQPILTDERILQIAERHRNHVLSAQSGTKFDVIEHKDVVAFAREIETAERTRCLEIVWDAWWDACPQNGQDPALDFKIDICEGITRKIATGAAS